MKPGKNIPLPRDFKKYAELKTKLSDIQEQVEVLGAKLSGQMLSDGIDQVRTDEGVYSLAERVSWLYSAKVEALAKKLSEQKQVEVIKGIAKPKSTAYYLVYNPGK